MLYSAIVLPFLLPAAYAQLNDLAKTAVSVSVSEIVILTNNTLGLEILRNCHRQSRIDRYCLRRDLLKHDRIWTNHTREFAEGSQMLVK